MSDRIRFFELEMAVTIMHFFIQIANLKNSVVNAYIQKHVIYLLGGIQRVMDGIHQYNQHYLMMMNESATMSSEKDKDLVEVLNLFYKSVVMAGSIYDFDMRL